MNLQDISKYLEIQLSSWWKRTLIFIVSSVLTTTILYGLYVSMLMSILISLLLVSISVESLRAKRYSLLFGLQITEKTIGEILYSMIFSIVPFLLLIIIASLYSIEISISGMEFNIFISISIFIFIWAFVEELSFRGIIFQAILDRFGYIGAILASSLVFSAAHISNYNFDGFAFINTFIAGILLGTMYLQSRSLYLPIFFHFFWNFFQWLSGSRLSGWEYGYSITVANYTELPSWLFGGSYGIEGGLFTTIMLISILAITLKLIKPSPYITSKLYKREIGESFF